MAKVRSAPYPGSERPACRESAMSEGLYIPALPAGCIIPTMPPARPDSFGDEFRLPGHEARLLEMLNPHTRDVRIEFIAEGHIYKVDGKPTRGSVTKLVHEFAQQFDADAVIKRMMSGDNWPRDEYVHLNGEPLSASEIKEKWERNRLESANRGTWMHWQFELHLNRCPVELDGPEMNMFIKFLRSLGGFTAFRTEWEIFGEAECIAGSVDFVAKAANGSLLLVDWKRSKSIKSKYDPSFRRAMKAPLDGLLDCAGIHYRLQLNCYRYIIQKYYDMTVNKMMVVGTHPDNNGEAFVDDVPVMIDETEALMTWQRLKLELPKTV